MKRTACLALLVIVAAACGREPVAEVPTPSAMSAAPSPSPAPTSGSPVSEFACTEERTSPALAIGLIRGGAGFEAAVVVDLHDPQQPKILCRLTNPSFRVRFASAGEVVTPVSGSGLVKLTLKKQTTRTTLTDGRVEVWDLSPDGRTLVYVGGPGTGSEFWVRNESQAATMIDAFAQQPGRDGSWDDQILIRFSPSGKYFVVVNTVTVPNTFQIRRASDGKVVWASPSEYGSPQLATMAAWARQTDRLYFRDGTGVRTWDPTGIVTTLVPGLKWYHPSISPDGRSIGYTVYDQAAPGEPRFPHVELLDLQSTKAHTVGQRLRYHPFFLTSSVVLYGEAESQYGFPAQRSFALDLRTGQETELPFAFITDVWPH